MTDLDSRDAGLYARSFADVYDDWYAELDDATLLVRAFTGRLPSGARIVEFGSGTGRLAAPLHNAGFEVVALDISQSMLSVTPHGIATIASDIAQVAVVDECADAVLIAYNTLFNLDRHDLQQRCFDEAARILRTDGLLAIEAFVLVDQGDPVEYGVSTRPHPTDPTGQLVIVTGPPANKEATNDLIVGSHIECTATATTCRPWQLAYQSPTELDAAAMRSGLRLVSRTADWSGETFVEDSVRHVSWYQQI